MPNIKVEVIIPRELVNTTELNRALRNTTKGMLKSIKVDFDVTTQTWNNRPKFTMKQTGKIEGVVETDNKIYKFVSGGTKPHPIRARRAPMLRFQAGYKAKTRPNSISSRMGGSFGETVVRKEVFHPGINPRNFDKVIHKKWLKLVPRILQRAIDSELS